MLGGVAVRDLAADTASQPELRERTRWRDGCREIYFLLSDVDRVLPVYLAGRMQLLPWGARRGQGGALPLTPWIPARDLMAGRWAALAPLETVIPASRALDNGIWYDIRDGVRAMVLREDQGAPVVYPLVEPASHYYRGMTGSEWMPCLVRQRI